MKTIKELNLLWAKLSDINVDDNDETENYPLLILKYFRDVSPDQRHLILDRMRSVPEGLSDTLTLAQERLFLDSITNYSQYTKINKPSQTTSTKCQYQATPSKPKWLSALKCPFCTR